MGSNRKRPAEKSLPPTKEGKKKEGKSKKKKIKFKSSSKDNSSGETPKSSLETTATAEGQIMAQVLSTFSRLEQSRFEAFRRATFPSDAISKYVAHCLLQQDPTRKQAPVLSHVCAPGQSEEIAIVVNTLAKAYAQRLVTAARRAAPDDTPIQPQHILHAFQERQAQGLDPGFFLQPSEQSTALQLNNNEHSKKRFAALHLQDEYDKEQEKLAEEETKLAAEEEKKLAEEEKKLAAEEKEEESTGMDISPAKEAKVDEPATEPAKTETG